MAGEIGFELQGPIDHTAEITEAIMEAGADFGIKKLGGRTVFILFSNNRY